MYEFDIEVETNPEYSSLWLLEITEEGEELQCAQIYLKDLAEALKPYLEKYFEED